MARVNKDTNWAVNTFRPEIKKQHFGQDPYFYRDRINRTNKNDRSPSDYQKKIKNALTIANEIWNKKPPCWRDHFYRSTLKTRIEGTEPDTKYRELTGYHLYVTKQMEALARLDGNYYNPTCFCIQPRDWVGWRLNAYGRFNLKNGEGLTYLYDETKKLLKFDNCTYKGRDPFRSAAFLYDYNLVSGYLNCNFTMKRIIHPFNRDIDFWDIKDAVMWFPLHFRPQGYGPGSHVNLWDCCNWKINQVNICDCDRDGEPVNCIDGVFLPSEYVETQCFKDYFGFSMKYNSKGVIVQLSGTDKPPFYDVYWRDTKVGTFGVGYGDATSVVTGEAGGIPVQDLPDTMDMSAHLEPCPIGTQKCHKPSGTVHPASLDYTEVFDPCPTLGGARLTRYFYSFGEPIPCRPRKSTPELRITTTPPVYDERAGFNPAPWGAVTVWFMDSDGNYHQLSPFARDIEFEEGKTEYCINNVYANCDAVAAFLGVSSDPIGYSCCRTFLTSLSALNRPLET